MLRTAQPIARLVFLLVVCALGLTSAAWRTEANAYGEAVEAFLASAIEAGDDCQAIATALEAWEEAERARAEAATTAFATAIDQLATREELAQVTHFFETTWERLFGGFGQPGDPLEALAICVNQDDRIATQVSDYIVLTGFSIQLALDLASERIELAAERARPADLARAALAADTFVRLIARYHDLVDVYGGRGCEAWAQAHGRWYANYFEQFDESAEAFSRELARMNPSEVARFAATLDRIAAVKPAFTVNAACAEVRTDEVLTLAVERATLADIVELVLMNVPQAE